MQAILIGSTDCGVLECAISRIYVDMDDGRGSEKAARYFSRLVTACMGKAGLQDVVTYAKAIEGGLYVSPRRNTDIVFSHLFDDAALSGMASLNDVWHMSFEIAVIVNFKDGRVQDVVLAQEKEKAEKEFLDMCRSNISNFDEYDADDIEAILGDGMEQYGGGNHISLCWVEVCRA